MSESNSRSHCSVALVIFIAMCTGWSMPAVAMNSPSLLPPPTVVIVAPSNGSILRCPTMTDIAAQFSTSMDPASINYSTFTLTGPGGATVSGVVAYNDTRKRASFTPADTLVPTTMYTAVVSTGATDTNGSHLESKIAWSFTTSPVCRKPNYPPSEIAVSPPDRSEFVCPNGALITAKFNHAMNPDSINSTTFIVTGPGGVSVSGTVTYSVATHVATFSPAVELAIGTMFTATITTGVTDIVNKPLNENLEWSFTVSSGCASPVPRM